MNYAITAADRAEQETDQLVSNTSESGSVTRVFFFFHLHVQKLPWHGNGLQVVKTCLTYVVLMQI